ncbi:hypothetical protein NC653_011573 [Populus alba x Populus x berolinensis]|uniref:AMP-dependent synthetase/ligase domain-containing protein n=1 Tax=Populus alba x Populus x berolinensis TaxID=444605 RepID=A0AAD6W6Q6_9ROSI|nr:hypothetical protein NC653_011573 [Populus alba x Populus x berolinensis]
MALFTFKKRKLKNWEYLAFHGKNFLSCYDVYMGFSSFIIDHFTLYSFAPLPKFSQGSLDCELPPKKKTDVCTIMYSSGTTGEPKGVIVANGALMAEVLSAAEEDSYFSFLPLAHVYGQIIETCCIYKGASIGFWRGVRSIMKFCNVCLPSVVIQELKQSIFCGVPIVYNSIYTGILIITM